MFIYDYIHKTSLEQIRNILELTFSARTFWDKKKKNKCIFFFVWCLNFTEVSALWKLEEKKKSKKKRNESFFKSVFLPSRCHIETKWVLFIIVFYQKHLFWSNEPPQANIDMYVLQHEYIMYTQEKHNKIYSFSITTCIER